MWKTNGQHCTSHSQLKKGHVDVAKVLIQNGADVNAVDEKWTALHCAAQEGHVDDSELHLQLQLGMLDMLTLRKC